jgi:hypothetical protein
LIAQKRADASKFNISRKTVSRIETQFLGSRREIVDRAKQNAVVENTAADANDGFVAFKRIPRNRSARTEIVVVFDDRFTLIPQPVTEESDSDERAIRPGKTSRRNYFPARTAC